MRFNRNAFLRWRPVLMVFVVALALLTVAKISSAARTGNSPDAQQDAIRLEGRISQLEQRLVSIETSLRNLEQQSRLAGATSRTVNSDEVARLSSQLQLLQRRIADDECGLVRLDERTLAPEVRSVRRKSTAAGGDPCRQNVDAPLILSSRRE